MKDLDTKFLTWASRKVASLMGDDVAVVLDRRGHVACDGLQLFARALKFDCCLSFEATGIQNIV